MYSYIKKNKTFRLASNDILRFTAKYPSFDVCEAPKKLYAQLAESALGWCETEEYPRLCSLLEEKRKAGGSYAFSPTIYSFAATVLDCDERSAEIKLTVTIYKERQAPSHSFEHSALWSLEHGLIRKKRKK